MSRAVRSPTATRLARPARCSRQNSFTRCGATVSSAAWSRCASAVAKASLWLSRRCIENAEPKKKELASRPLYRLLGGSAESPKHTGDFHVQDQPRTEQAARSQSLRHAVQQAGLRCRRTLLVGSLHPAQRPYSAGPRWLVQPRSQPSQHAALRKSPDPRRGRLRDRPWPVLRPWTPAIVGRG